MRSLWVFVTLLSVVSRASAQSDETQLWNELKTTVGLTHNIDFVAAGALRFEDGFSDLHRASFQLGPNFRLQPWLTLFPNYQYIVTNPAGDGRRKEHRPGVVIAARIPIKPVEVTLSLGTEYRFREDNENSWRLRPKLKIKCPVGPDRWTLGAYVAEEPFYDSVANEFVRNRLFVGVEKKLVTNWSADVYYCHQQDLQGRGPDLNIIGLSMSVRFDLASANRRIESTEK